MKIAIIGTGYVGLVQGVVLADFGLNVLCMDSNEEKIKKLKNGEIPIFEPGLTELLRKNEKANRIRFTTEYSKVVDEYDVIFIAVPTPASEDGSADLKHVLDVATQIGKRMKSYKLIVNKSTVPVGTGQLVKKTIQNELKKRDKTIEFDIVSNPEFLREGKAIGDCLRPDRVIVGAESKRAFETIKEVYNVLYLLKTPFVFTNIETAEMIKYASNSFLAVKISFINEMALLAEKVGANVQEIASAMGMDGRISPKFLHAGAGFGGSCFPKDTRAIAKIAKAFNEEFLVVEAAIKANKKQIKKMSSKIISALGNVGGKRIGILGLSFKPDTDDMRDAPSIDIIRALVNKKAKINAFCPQGKKEAKWRMKDIQNFICYADDEYECLENVDAAVLLTEWNQFRGIDLKRVKKLMRGDSFFDFRNVFVENREIRKLFKYYPVGLR